MRIKELTLFTNKLAAEKAFYGQTLGFAPIAVEEHSFSVQVGWTKLKFQESVESHFYHYCFLIPCNKMDEAIEWLKERLEIVEIKAGQLIQHFESWNAHSVYFYDGSGNLAEFIVRHDLNNDSTESFDLSNILCVNEIGMPVSNVATANNILETQLNSPLWKGDKLRFGVNGTQEGLFLLPNYRLKKKWFPTNLKVEPFPFKALINANEIDYEVNFDSENISISQL